MALERPPLPPSLIAQTQRRQALQVALRRALPDELARHMFLLNVRGGTLVMGCDAQALVTPLRFHAPALLDAARNMLIGETCPARVAWRTIPPQPRRKPLHGPRGVSPETAEGVAMAARCVEDTHLRDALSALAHSLARRRAHESVFSGPMPST